MKEKINENISMKRILKVSVPLIISMLSINIMTFFDRAFISNYEITQFSASVPANYLAVTLTSIFLGIITFASSIISQYYGAKKKIECSKCFWQTIYLSGIFTSILVLLLPITTNIFKWIGHEKSLIHYEKIYFYFILASSCVQLFSTAFVSFFSALGNTKIQMIVGISTNIINIVLDWILIYGKFGFKELGGVVGAGLGTLISTIVGLIIYIYYT